MLPYLRLLRPHQWLKNVFVLMGLVFAHAWGKALLVHEVALAFVAFCLMSSAVYVVNDWRDREADAQHPEKRHRPLASGAVNPTVAALLAALCAFVAGVLAAQVGPTLLLIVLLYAAINLGYSFGLKHQVLIDVWLIAAGFMLRLLAGTTGVGIPPSKWLLLTGLFVTLFLGFTKRRAELSRESAQGKGHGRRVLKHYNVALLDKFIGVSAAGTAMTYSLYTLAPETVARQGEGLVYTVPLVLFGLFRYLYRVHAGAGEDTARDVLRDPQLIAVGLGWLALVLWTTV